MPFARPDADITAGGWTPLLRGNPLFEQIDEVVVDDSDLIESSERPSTDLCEVNLSDVIDPSVNTSHVVRYRYDKESSTVGYEGQLLDLVVRLMEGAVEIASWTHNNIGLTLVTAAQTLTGVQADAIGDYTDLRFQFEATTA